MCGIIGIVGDEPAVEHILKGLQRLEYRGYDSAGVATLEDGVLRVVRTKGKLAALCEAMNSHSFRGGVGMGHTRWATHGVPSEANAHPHSSCRGDIALVHNGIVENHRELRKSLIAKGHIFRSETDTEVVVHLIEEYAKRADPEKAFRKAVSELEGNFAIVAVFAAQPNLLFGARKGSPLVVGLGAARGFLASDVPAILEWTRQVIYLEEGEMAVVGAREVRVCDFRGKARPAQPREVDMDLGTAEKEGFPHFMLKEIHEQPQGVRATVAEREKGKDGGFDFAALFPSHARLKRFTRVLGLACGTAMHAAMTGKYAVEELAGLPMEVTAASEFRYGAALVGAGTLVIAVSQSGETADTLAGVRTARERGAWVVAVTNVVGSSIAREADGVLYTRAGLEIGVAATKTYTAQLAALFMLAIHLGRARATLPSERARRLVRELHRMPRKMQQALDAEDVVLQCAERYKDAPSFMYIGRRNNFPNALEGALKLKEISYLHAEGYPGGEMKHGPLALVDPTFPTVAIVVQGSVHEKMLSNIQEIKARSGQVIAIATEADPAIPTLVDWVIPVPPTDEIFSPMLTVIPLQLLAYHIAVKRGCDVDQPRNLAKSVTVE